MSFLGELVWFWQSGEEVGVVWSVEEQEDVNNATQHETKEAFSFVFLI